ncbi:MAG: ATPase [Gammaproteobacteria bacterium]
MRTNILATAGVALAGFTACLVSRPAPADVLSSSPSGFIVRIEVPVAATPTDVYSRFFEVGKWWSGEHTYSGKASNLTLRNEPGGCFCEALPGGGFVRHASLEYSASGKAVRLTGALGPLQELGAHGLLSFNFTPDKANPGTGAGTRLIVTYVISGYQPDKGFAPLAEPVNGVLREQVDRFRRFVETGKPVP